MSPKKQLLHSLEDLAKQLGIRVRYEKTSARGGLCLHHGTYKIIIDPKSSDDFKTGIIAGALKSFDLSGFFISPKLRDFLELREDEDMTSQAL
ncbi:MAG: hypothetical protein LBH05_00625 [Deferribacteraceae bacterium]|jgi:hypothetical protein|nr:hypothetical protein [Deferribacteraceae bacterium]